MFFGLTFTVILIRALVLVTALPVHECAHAWVASKLGDNTARNQGRITLNPMKHLDLFGSIAMLFVGFGWAKPVQINPRNFKNPKVGMAISSLAGPVSNIILAYILLIVLRVLNFVGFTKGLDFSNLMQIFQIMVLLNIGLAIFNLLPIPPLDGSRIATLFLPQQTYFKIMQYEQYIFIGLIVLMYSGVLTGPILFLQGVLYNSLWALSNFLVPIFNMVK